MSASTLLISVFAALALLGLIELLFRIFYRRKHGHGFHVAIKFPWNRMHIVSHPFLTFTQKKNEVIDRNQRLPYPLHYHEYFSFNKPLRTNNLGYFGERTDRQRSPGVLRIACLGDSVTSNHIADETKDYSYPILLQEYLAEHLAGKNGWRSVEVLNCGVSGWVSTDIMIDFLLNVLPLRPDYVVLYHGITDLHLYLTEDFASDYSHARCNLAEAMHRIKRAHRFPKIPFWHSYEFVKDALFGTGNIWIDMIERVRKQKPDLSRPYHDLGVQKNILKNIIIVCQHYGIRCIMSSYAFYAYKQDEATLKMAQGVRLENQQSRHLAAEFEAIFVDQAALIPQDDAYFLDWIHLTPKGMTLLAEHFGNAILNDLSQAAHKMSPRKGKGLGHDALPNESAGHAHERAMQ